MEMDYTQFNLSNLLDIVSTPGFSNAVLTHTTTTKEIYKNQLRKEKIKKLLKRFNEN